MSIKDRMFPFGQHAGDRVGDLDEGYLNFFINLYDTDQISSYRMRNWFAEHIDDIRAMIEGNQLEMVEADTEEYDLSPSQLDASTCIQQAFLTGIRYARLEGGAGYGKSFAVRDIVRELIRSKQFIIKACAVSYVATQVLKSQLDRYNVPCMTMARAIGLEKVYDGPREIYRMGDQSHDALEKLFRGTGGKRALVVIDEYSMVCDEYANALGNAAERYNGAILVVGDLSQLPPVDQDTDCVFSTIPEAHELQDPMRYSKDSDLYQVEQFARYEPFKVINKLHTEFPESDEVFTYETSSDLLEAFKRTCKEFPHDDNRIVYYRRQDVIDANNSVRKVLFGDNPSALEPGERLMVVRTSDYDETRFYTGTTLDVIDVEHALCPTTGADYLYATLSSGKRIRILFAVNENKADPSLPGGEMFNLFMRELANKAQQDEDMGVKRSDAWAPYREFKDSFVFVAYNYATTVHKSQGATVDRIFVSPHALLGIPQVGDKLTYVALTRAKRELHIA